MAHFPGIPAVVTPEDAEWLKDNHPRYEEYKPVIEARLAVWREDNDPKFKQTLKTSEAKKRHELLRLVAGGQEPASVLDPPADGTGEVAEEPKLVVSEPTSVIPAAEPPAEEPQAEGKAKNESKSAGGNK